jgi:hypothetical protein
MDTAATNNLERSCGSADCNEVKLRTGTGAERIAETTAGLCEKMQSAQWERSTPDGDNSSCEWTDCTKPSPAINSTASTAVNRRQSDLSNWGANLMLTFKYYS